MSPAEAVEQGGHESHNRSQRLARRMGDPAEVLFPQDFESSRRKRTGVFVQRRQIVGIFHLTHAIAEPAAKGRELVVHVYNDTHSSVCEELMNSFCAVLLVLQAMTVTNRVHAEDQVE